ncbi:MAG: hypothetical protein NTY93_01790 [Candidatus Kaiserbacteria bacterium]|nr:hypothetical protein [Candidatus Kaiserbacteria bacterium]
MADKLNTILFKEISPPPRLLSAVLAHIDCARRRAAHIRIVVFGSVLAVSGGMLIPAVSYALHEFYASGFYDYFSIFFSDSSMAAAYWRELLLSMAETLPSLAILFLLVFMATALWSLRHVLRDYRNVFATVQHA